MTANLRFVPLPSTVPEISALDLFRSVVELGSLGRAAEAHLITQPSASSRMKSLERTLGLALLDRSPTGSTPTADGRLVAEYADAVLRAADDLANGVAALKADQAGQLRLAASYTLAEYILPVWLETFLSDRPNDSVSLDVTNSRAVIDRVRSGAIDLGFIESPTVPIGMNEQVVGADEIIAVASPRHEWTATRRVDLATFASTPMVLRERGSGTRESLVAELARLGHDSPPSVLDLGSISAVRIAVINGASPTVISRLAVADDLATGRLVEINVKGLRIERMLRAIWLSGHKPNRLAQALLVHLSTRSNESDHPLPSGTSQ